MQTKRSKRIAPAAGDDKAPAPQAPARRRLLGWCAGLAGAGIAAAAGARAALELPVFGGSPSDRRIARILASPNWKDGAFRNLVSVPVTTSDKSTAQALFSFLTEDRSARAPAAGKTGGFLPDSAPIRWCGSATQASTCRRPASRSPSTRFSAMPRRSQASAGLIGRRIR